MTVLRIVPNIAAASIEAVRNFYAELFDLDIVMGPCQTEPGGGL